MAEFKMAKPRLYLNFLDSKFGRGSLIIFIQLLIIESKKAVIIILGIIVLLIGVVGIVLGWNEGSDGNETKDG